MYESFYGITRTPFAVTPDPAMLFMSKVHREALATIIYGVETRKGFIVCTGEVGTGKSTIIRAFFDQTLADAVKLIYIFTPQVTPLEIAKYICREMEMEEPDSIFAAVPRLQMKLLEMFEAGKTVVLMIDEAQLLPPETLEFLRLLSNFETDTEKLIQIVLVGQPEVDTVLARRDMRQVNQRVALRARLAPLSVEESFEYIDHRIRISGAPEMAQVMSPSAAWLIAEAAGGIPRVINILADNVMIAGFGAGQRPIGSYLAGNTVREFLNKSGPAKPAPGQRLTTGWRAAMRLRGALAREKEEAEDWIPAIAAAPAPAPAPTLAMQPPRPVETPPRVPEQPHIVDPIPAPAQPAAAAPLGSVLVEPIAKPAPPRPVPIVTTPSSEPAIAAEDPVPEPLPAVHGSSVAPVFIEPEPIAKAPAPNPGIGLPVAIEGLVMFAPLAASEPIPPPPPPPPLPPPAVVSSPQAIAAAPTPTPDETPAPIVEPQRPTAPSPMARPKPAPIPEPLAPVSPIPEPAPRGSVAIPPRRRIPPPLPRPYYTGPGPSAPQSAPAQPASPAAQWPALSRVRSDLRLPRRG